MERLTIEYDGNYVPKRMCTINVLDEADDCESCDIYCKEAYEKDYTCNSCAIQECFDRLAAYEGTGITPDQLQVINEEYQKMAKELAELRQQNSENPYKVGDTVYCIEEYDDGFDYAGYRYLGECNGYIIVCPTYTWCNDLNEQLREMTIKNTGDARANIYLLDKLNAYRTKEEAKAAVAKLDGV